VSSRQSRRRSEPTLSQFDALVTRLYEAATNAELWPQALESMVRFVGNSGVHLFLTDESTGLVRQDAYFGMPKKLMIEYNNGQVVECPRVENALAHPEFRLLYDYQHIDENGIDRSEYYHWLQRSGDGIRYYLGAQLFPTAGRPSWISFPFRRSEGHAQKTHMERLKLFVPHLERALRVGQQFGTASLLSGALAQSIDQEERALIVLSESGKVLFASNAAESLARHSQWMRLSRLGVSLADPALDRELQHRLHDCRQIIGRNAASAADDIEVACPDGNRYRILLAPLMFHCQKFGVDQPAVVVTFTQVGAEEIALRKRLQGLTGAELALAIAVARGSTLTGYARGRGISLHTVRAQLKIIFQKTGTHRQAELVSLILHGHHPPAPI
jgi:DNA-binding CsgD family transcriptional regulator